MQSVIINTHYWYLFQDYKDDPKKAEEKLVSDKIKKAYLYEV